MKDQIKLIIGNRLTLCTRVVKGKVTFLRADKDLGDACYLGYQISKEANALHAARMRVHHKNFWKSASSFVEPLIIQ